MHLAITHGETTVDVTASGLRDETTLADLAASLGVSVGPTCAVDGASVPSAARACHVLYEGAALDLDPPGPVPPAPVPVVELHATTGPPGGRVWRLAPGSYTVGVGDATIAWPGGPVAGATVTVSAAGAVMLDGTPLERGHPVPIGDTSFVAEPCISRDPAVDGAVTFNRPPRRILAETAPALTPPARATPQAPPRRRAAATLVLPAVFGIGMAVAFGRITLLAFALMGPLMAMGNAVDDRRRWRQERRSAEQRYASEMTALGKSVAAAAHQARSRQRANHPAPAALLSAVDHGASRIWERRPHHLDFLRLCVGTGRVSWDHGIRLDATAELEVRQVLRAAAVMPDCPVTVDMSPGAVVGVHGARPDTLLTVCAWLAQAAALHGPADVRIAILTDTASRWDWAKWLPHTWGHDGATRLLASTPDQAASVLGFLRSSPADGTRPPLTLVVSDLDHLERDLLILHGAVLAGAGAPVAAIVIREKRTDLPGRCTTVVRVAGGRAEIEHPSELAGPVDVAAWTMSEVAIRHLARRMSRLTDPEARGAATALPDAVPLLAQLRLRRPTPAAVRDRWRRQAPDRLRAPLGAAPDGPLEIDLVAHGPHGLVAGTTGSGKSELLRSLVAGLAARYDPDHLTVVLIDYKGGAAFDACSRLPHVVGVLTDLDAHLGARALTCLEAELRYRERRLRSAGASDIAEYAAGGSDTPLPRMLVVVDEFATLAADLPEFMTALVDVAQRGRSLGVHLLLATQRPAGVVNAAIQANTNLRIALRVHGDADSKDVLGVPAAARLPRSRPGRAVVRLGPGELVPIQAAIATLPRGSEARRAVTLIPFAFGPHALQPDPPPPGGPTELEVLVDAIVAAHREAGLGPVRRAWPEPLPAVLRPGDLPRKPTADPAGVVLGLRDEPEQQRQVLHVWDPATDGNLLLAGTHGPGEALRAIAYGLAPRSPDAVNVYAIDHGSGDLAAVGRLPHTGAVVAAADRERRERLLRMLRDEIARRRAGSAATPAIVFIVDGLAGYLAAFDDVAGLGYRQMLDRIAADGPAVGVSVVVTTAQARSLPGVLAGSFSERLVFRLADPLEYGMLGIPPRAVPALDAGRAVTVPAGREVQVLAPSDADIGAVTNPGLRTARRVGTLPDVVEVADVVGAADWSDDTFTVPFGIDGEHLRPATVRFHPGDHAVITGTDRSGKSTLLAALAVIARHADSHALVIAVCPRGSPLPDAATPDQVWTDACGLEAYLAGSTPARMLVLVDDADALEDPGGVLTRFIGTRRAGAHLVAAARGDGLRGSVRHWTSALRSARRGIVLQPHDAGDGDPVGARLPRILPERMPPGRGYICDRGSVALVQTPIP